MSTDKNKEIKRRHETEVRENIQKTKDLQIDLSERMDTINKESDALPENTSAPDVKVELSPQITIIGDKKEAIKLKELSRGDIARNYVRGALGILSEYPDSKCLITIKIDGSRPDVIAYAQRIVELLPEGFRNLSSTGVQTGAIVNLHL